MIFVYILKRKEYQFSLVKYLSSQTHTL